LAWASSPFPKALLARVSPDYGERKPAPLSAICAKVFKRSRVERARRSTAARKKVEQDRLLGVANGAKRLLSAAAHWLFETDGFHGSIMHVINAQENRFDFSGLSFEHQF